MSAAEWWLLAAAIAAGLAALLAASRPHAAAAWLASTLGHIALGLVAVALLIALP
jgi:hypothetical protein